MSVSGLQLQNTSLIRCAVAFTCLLYLLSSTTFSQASPHPLHLLSVYNDINTANVSVRHVEKQPLGWALAYPQNIIYNRETGGLTPLGRTGWQNGAEGFPLTGDFELEFIMVIGSCARHIGDGDFLVGYTIVDPDSTNILSHGWSKDDKAMFLLFDQGCIVTSMFGICWQDDVGFNSAIGDTIMFRLRRAAGTVSYRITWRNETYSGIIERENNDLIWPVAAFFRQGGTLLSATILSGNRVVPVKQNPYTIWIGLGSTFLFLFVTLYIRLWVRSRKKIKEQRILIREQEKALHAKEAVETERTRIASEMHDDLGSGLTTIRYLSDKALKQAEDKDEAEQIRRIAEHSNRLVRNMSEIIWAMNARFDNAESLTGYLRRYASEFLDEYNLPVKFAVQADALHEIPVSGEKRRNLFLVFKEVLHNTVKYSGAQEVQIAITATDMLQVEIIETGGRGFDPETSRDKGNGLYNCRKRMEVIGGEIGYEKTEEGMRIVMWVQMK